MTILLLTLLACTSTEKGDDSGRVRPTDTGTAIDTGGDPEISGLSVTTVADMTAVFIVEWDTLSPATSWVEFGPATAYGLTTVPSATPATHHKIVVVGAPFGADWHWRAASDVGGTVAYSADQVHSGGQKPAGLHGYDREAFDRSKVDGGIRMIPYFTSSVAGIQVVNADGDLVWHHEYESPEGTIQVAQTEDGSGLLYMIGDLTRRTDIGEIRYLSWDRSTTWSIRAEWAHHDFQLLPDGSWAFLAADIRERDGELVAGDAVIRMDADGGNPRSIWSTWDHLEIPSFTGCRPTYYPDYCDWTHANGLWYEASNDTFAVSIHNDDTIYVMDADGDKLYAFGSADYADVQPATPEDAFVQQHGAEYLGANQWAIFDNGEYPPDGHSRALILDVDPAASTFEATWIYDWGSRYSSTILGDHDVLPNGNHLLSWGSEAEVTEVTDEGELVWQLAFDLGASLGFVGYEATAGGVIP